MRKFLLPFFLFIAFIFESIFVELIPTETFGIDRIFVPRFIIILIMLIAFFYDRNKAVLFGIIFGMLFDIVYTDMLGIYMFSFPFVAYLISHSMKVLHSNIFVILIVSLMGLGMLETLVYGLYQLVDVVNLDWYEFLYNRLLPTLVLNGVFLIVVYYPMRRFLDKLEKLSNKESDKLL